MAQAQAAAKESRARRGKDAERANSGARPGITEFTAEEELTAYREMLLIRRFEEKAGQLYGMGLIGGVCHLYIRPGAVGGGVQMAMMEGGQGITGYRDHGPKLGTRNDPKRGEGGAAGPPT